MKNNKAILKKHLTIQVMLPVLLYCWVSACAAAVSLPNPKERIDYWRQNYRELTELDDKRVIKAHEIFSRVLKAAGKRYGVIPRLHLIKENPFNVVLPVSIPDGWIILSQKVLDMAFKDKTHGEDRLAFVLAHEIAHLLDDDFWHMNFFSALSLLQQQSNEKSDVINEIQGIFTDTEKIQAKELRADERGILFVAMAGYDPHVIAGKDADSDSGFFHEWHEMLDVTRYPGLDSSSTHPTSSQRATAVAARLRQVSDQSDLFRMGMIFYQTGKFAKASKAFGEFLRYFPGREVYHNLAATYHQLALNYYQYKTEMAARHLLPFRLPIMADPYTRAAFGISRGKTQDRRMFARYLEQAIKYYLLAIEQDENYTLAYQNLASAYLLNDEPYKAIATLKDIVKRSPDNATLLNILGVGFYLTENVEKATKLLQRAIKINPRFVPAYYNLGKIAWLQGQKPRAKKLWQAFVDIEPQHQWSSYLVSNFNLKSPRTQSLAPATKLARTTELLMEVQVGNYLDEIPKSWGNPRVKDFTISDARHTLLEYDNGVSIIAEGDEVRIIVAGEKFQGKSKQGVAIGSNRHSVVSHYGLPELNLRSTQGNNLLYPREGISFQFANNKVVSWAVY